MDLLTLLFIIILILFSFSNNKRHVYPVNTYFARFGCFQGSDLVSLFRQFLVELQWTHGSMSVYHTL